jgi:glutamate-5-semialdehyde dehydrogenase
MKVEKIHNPGNQLMRDLRATREASRGLVNCDDQKISSTLEALADRIIAEAALILKANQSDLARMDEENPKYDRLLLDMDRLRGIAHALRHVAQLPSPIGEVLQNSVLENGMTLKKIRVPMGVIAVIFESRPNVTFDVFSLCLKTRNACVLKGSSDAKDTNEVAVRLMKDVLIEAGLEPDVVFLAPPQRQYLGEILQAVGEIDLAIPRGSRGLIDFVRDHARIPVIETGAGIVHTYIDRSADIEKARKIITNAKARRVSVCNALDTVLIHQELLPELPYLLEELGEEYNAEVFADAESFRVLEGVYPAALNQASEHHFGEEFLSMRLSVKTVSGLKDALEHIHQYSSKHTEAVLATDEKVIETFLNQVDAAVVLANASTAFTDGEQFGMGAEIGISTQKLHARGPMALTELTSYKWVASGDGHIRA